MCMLNAVGSCVVDAQSMLYLLLGDLYGCVVMIIPTVPLCEFHYTYLLHSLERDTVCEQCQFTKPHSQADFLFVFSHICDF